MQERYKELIEARLEGYMQELSVPATLQDAMSYSLRAGGKRLRPCMLLASCEMFGGNEPNALSLACALEMIHTYSLIHDDLPCMDNDDLRRGKPTSHKVFGEGMAVLAGDGLLSYAFEIMLTAGMELSEKAGYFAAMRVIVEGAGIKGMVAGQALDLENECQTKRDADTLFYIHSHKTGAMLKAAVLAGACVASAKEEEKRAIGDFGEKYGLLFQITDDILDAQGDPALLGKSVGKDANEGKLTYVSLYGLEHAKAMAAQTAKDAGETLRPFGERAAYFQTLLEKTLTRDK